MDYDSQRGKGLGQKGLKTNFRYFYVLTCSADSYGFFFFLFFSSFYSPSLQLRIVVVNFIGTVKSN